MSTSNKQHDKFVTALCDTIESRIADYVETEEHFDRIESVEKTTEEIYQQLVERLK
jgi:cyclopropane fatty-acyl-phospholipid synthase-like methyltransferase